MSSADEESEKTIVGAFYLRPTGWEAKGRRSVLVYIQSLKVYELESLLSEHRRRWLFQLKKRVQTYPSTYFFQLSVDRSLSIHIGEGNLHSVY
jgi:hypothetical protein